MGDEVGALLAYPLIREVVVNAGSTLTGIGALLAVRQSLTTNAFVPRRVVLLFNTLAAHRCAGARLAALHRICTQLAKTTIDVECVPLALCTLVEPCTFLTVGVER